jgi:preprotein translocase subunit SecG
LSAPSRILKVRIKQKGKIRNKMTIISWTLGVILIISNLLLILLVLLHRGRGGGLSDLFGGGFSSSLGGSSLAERNLDRFTIAIGLIWTASVIGLGLVLSA